LILWHVSQPDTYLAISPFLFDHQKFSLRSRYILVLPGWMVNLERWASSKISFFKSRSLGITNLCPNQTTPLSSLRKQSYLGSLSSNFYLIFWTSSSTSWAIAILSWRGDSIETEKRFPCLTNSKLSFLISSHNAHHTALTSHSCNVCG
jgi:hypothetical protein